MSDTGLLVLISDTIAAINTAIPEDLWATKDETPPAFNTIRLRLPIARDVLERIKAKV